MVLALAMMPDRVAAQSEVLASFRLVAPVSQPTVASPGSDGASGTAARVPAGWAVSVDQRAGSGWSAPEVPRARRIDGFVEVTLASKGVEIDSPQPVTWLFVPL